MRLLVTGGAGYIGSVMVERLIADGHQVVVLDDLSRGHRAAVHPEATFVEGSTHDAARVEAVLREHGIEGVLHFAAYALVGESVRDPYLYYHNNVAGTLGLLRGMARAGVKKLVFSSTCAVYGTPERVPIDEAHPTRPINPYGRSKRMVEEILAEAWEAYGLRSAALRYFNAAGASRERGEDHHPETHLIPLVLAVALGKRPRIYIYGTDYPTRDGTAIRDYIHVEDLADAHVRALLAMDDPGWKGLQVFNLGNGEGYSVREVIEAARRVTGHPIPAEEAPRRPGDPPVLVADARRAREVLGWTPRIPDIEAILASAWAWHQAHPYGYGALGERVEAILEGVLEDPRLTAELEDEAAGRLIAWAREEAARLAVEDVEPGRARRRLREQVRELARELARNPEADPWGLALERGWGAR